MLRLGPKCRAGASTYGPARDGTRKPNTKTNQTKPNTNRWFPAGVVSERRGNPPEPRADASPTKKAARESGLDWIGLDWMVWVCLCLCLMHCGESTSPSASDATLRMYRIEFFHDKLVLYSSYVVCWNRPFSPLLAPIGGKAGPFFLWYRTVECQSSYSSLCTKQDHFFVSRWHATSFLHWHNARFVL